MSTCTQLRSNRKGSRTIIQHPICMVTVSFLFHDWLHNFRSTVIIIHDINEYFVSFFCDFDQKW